MAQSGKLFLFPVPIAEGKLCGVLPSLNAELLAGLTLFFVEKTRTARRFIRILCPEKDIAPIRFIEIGKRCDPSEIESGLKAVAQGASAGILSEAGCPGVADPGAEVVRKAHRLGIEVIPLIGPSSLLLALMASGQNGQQFAFKGYLQYLIRTAALHAYYASVSEGSVHHTFAYAERGIRRMCRLSGRSKGSRKSDTPCSSLRRCPGKSGRRTPFIPVCSVA